jgi:hypothetical protein
MKPSPSTAYKPVHGGRSKKSDCLPLEAYLMPYQIAWLKDPPKRHGCAACDRGDHQLGHHHDCPFYRP